MTYTSNNPKPQSQKIANVHGLAKRVVDAPEAHARPWMAVELAHGFLALIEQLEVLREALEWCNDHRDSERFHSVAESALNFKETAHR